MEQLFLCVTDLSEWKCENVRFRDFRLPRRLGGKDHRRRMQTIHGGKTI
jgi:hypothetical protein